MKFHSSSGLWITKSRVYDAFPLCLTLLIVANSCAVRLYEASEFELESNIFRQRLFVRLYYQMFITVVVLSNVYYCGCIIKCLLLTAGK